MLQYVWFIDITRCTFEGAAARARLAHALLLCTKTAWLNIVDTALADGAFLAQAHSMLRAVAADRPICTPPSRGVVVKQLSPKHPSQVRLPMPTNAFCCFLQYNKTFIN